MTPITTAEISKLFNLTGERLRQLATAGHFPKPKRGKWDLKAVASGLVAHLQDRITNRRDSAEYLKAREGKMQSEEKLAAITLEAKQKTILSRAAVERVWVARNIAIREIITASPLPKSIQNEILGELENYRIENHLDELTTDEKGKQT